MAYQGKSIAAVMLVGGSGTRLWPLVDQDTQSKATLRVAGKRLAYFNADRIEEAGLKYMVLPVQFNKEEIKKKLRFGDYSFEEIRFTEASPKYFPEDIRPHFRGTADAVLQSEDALKKFEYMLVVPCDHITNIGYDELIDKAIFNHNKYGAVITTASMKKPRKEIAKTFGNPETDKNGRIIGWAEKPEDPVSDLAALGIYAGPTGHILEAIRKSGHDFGKHVLKYLMEGELLYSHNYSDEKNYWNDVGKPELLLKANMDLIEGVEGITGDRLPLRKVKSDLTGYGGRIENCLVTRKADPLIYGRVENSVIGDWSVIDEKARVSGSVLMGQNQIKAQGNEEIEIKDSIIGKRSVVSGNSLDNCVLGRQVTLHECDVGKGLKINTDSAFYRGKITDDVRKGNGDY